MEHNLFVIDSGSVQMVSMRQARLMLHKMGLLTHVQSVINALPEPQKTEAQIEWDYSQEVKRDFPLVAVMKQGLNLTDEQLDNLFYEAKKL